MTAFVAVSLLFAGLLGCGQRGPLTLPKAPSDATSAPAR